MSAMWWTLWLAVAGGDATPMTRLEILNADVQRTYDAILRDNGESVDYALLKQREDLQQALERYVTFLSELNPEEIPDKNEKIAILSNGYNILTLVGVNRAWPVASVRRIRPLFGFFTKDEWVLGGQRISLNKLEKEYLRSLDPRIHFIINCASASCPKLPPTVLTAENVEAEMEKATMAFLHNEEKNQFDKSKRHWRLSKIFKWYEDDWGKQQEVVAFIRRYRPDLAAWEPRKITYLEYDWALNGPTERPQNP